jgi:IPT/TIG domain-containing protein
MTDAPTTTTEAPPEEAQAAPNPTDTPFVAPDEPDTLKRQGLPEGVERGRTASFDFPVVTPHEVITLKQPVPVQLGDGYVMVQGTNIVAGEGEPDTTGGPNVTGINPSGAQTGGSDPVDVTINGTGFTVSDRAVIGTSDVPTTFVSDTELRITLQPQAAGDVPVYVRNGAYALSAPQTFSWSDPIIPEGGENR